jgi:hypothetical protein
LSTSGARILGVNSDFLLQLGVSVQYLSRSSGAFDFCYQMDIISRKYAKRRHE